MSEPVGNSCPGCGEPAELEVGTEQFFCGSNDCHVLMWNPTLTLEELQADIGELRIPPERST